MEDNKIDLTKEMGQGNQNDIKQEVHVESVIPEEVHPAGNSVSSSAPTAPDENSAAKKNKKIGTIAIIAAAAVVLIGGVAIASANTYKAPIENYFEAIEKENGKKLQKAFGKAVVSAMDDYLEEEDYYDDGRYDDIDELFEGMAESLNKGCQDKHGKNLKISYKITDKDKLDKGDLKDYRDSLKDSFDKKLKVTKGYEVDLKVTYKDKDDKDTGKMKLDVLKVNGKWMVASEDALMYTSLYSYF